MILRVEFDQFPETVKRLTPGDHAYVSPQPGGALVSAADPRTGVLIVSRADLSQEAAKARLEELGMSVFPGVWSTGDNDVVGNVAPADLYVAAVAYVSEDPKPGLWLDSYPEEPTLAQVMRSMYDEFVANGEVPPDVSLEEFIRLANPNVVIWTPQQLSDFAEAKADC